VRETPRPTGLGIEAPAQSHNRWSGVAWHTIAINGISGFTYLEGLLKMVSQLKEALMKQKSDAEVRVRLECFEEKEKHVL
jgi:hypothetical protein